MNTDKQIILDLIVEDLCMQQFLSAMESIGITWEYEPAMQKTIAALMGITSEQHFNEWFNKYNYVYDVALKSSYHDKKSLRILAENYIMDAGLASDRDKNKY